MGFQAQFPQKLLIDLGGTIGFANSDKNDRVWIDSKARNPSPGIQAQDSKPRKPNPGIQTKESKPRNPNLRSSGILKDHSSDHQAP